MSVLETTQLPLPGGSEEREAARPSLRLIEGLRNRHRISRGSVIVALSLIVAVLGAQLVLSLMLISGAYAEDELATARVQAQRERTAAQEKVDAMASPQHLAKMATDLGMVPAAAVPSLDLETGSIIGATDASVSLPAVNTDLVPNSITNGDRDRAEQAKDQKPQKAEQSGASKQKSAVTDVPSDFKLSLPETH